MNLGYIKDEIYNLNYETKEDYSEKPSVITQAINRAIQRICNEVKPILGKFVISQFPFESLLPNPLYNLDMKHYSGEPIVFSADGAKSYYFECDGTGQATIKDDAGSVAVTMTSNREFKAYKGFCNGNVTITFSGDFSYNIRNVAVYGEKLSADVKDIPPYTRNVYYDFKEITKEDGKIVFDGFADEMVRDDNADIKPISDFKVMGRDTLVLNGFEKCQFSVYYKKKPTTIAESTPDDFEMELDNNIQVLLPVLASFYVWNDDNLQRATQYYNDYEAMRNMILGKEQKVIAVVNGGEIL